MRDSMIRPDQEDITYTEFETAADEALALAAEPRTVWDRIEDQFVSLAVFVWLMAFGALMGAAIYFAAAVHS